MTKIISREEYDTKWENKCTWKVNCPYCNIDTDLNTVLYESDYWKMFISLSSYTGNENHILAFPKEHKKYFSELSDEEILDLKNIHKFCDTYFWENNYFSATRETMANRSIEHYHQHFIQWKLQAEAIVNMLKNQNNN